MVLKRVFLFICFVISMTAGFMSLYQGEAQAAKSHSLSYFNHETYVDDGRKWLRIELGMKDDGLEYTAQVNPDKPKQLNVVLTRTDIGSVDKDEYLDLDIARYMTLRPEGKRDLRLMVSFTKTVAEQEYRVYTRPAEKSGSKPYRLVIEIAENQKTVEPPPTPVKPVDPPKPIDQGEIPGVYGWTIVLDPGHGGSDSGAIGPKGLMEKNVTLAVSLEAAKLLRNSGAKVVLTRAEDIDVFGPNASDRDELQARVDAGRIVSDMNIYVSIHCNAFSDSAANGTGTYYCAHSEMDALLAQCIQTEMVKETGLRNRGINAARFYVLRNSEVPAALVETAFITNPREERMLGDEIFQHRMALAICRGIGRYFSEMPK